MITSAEAVIDNGTFGTRTVRFETGRLAQQAGGSVAAYLDEDTICCPRPPRVATRARGSTSSP